MTTVAVIDFETTGLSPALGDRATEIAIVLLEGEQVVDRYQSLMNAGVRISSFIEAYTGISNAMVAAAPHAAHVMAEASRFVAGRPMAAHNASFDRRFWTAELARIDQPAPQAFACTLSCHAGFIRWRRTTGSVRSPRFMRCRPPDGPTGRWPMRRWPRPCWGGSVATCASGSRCQTRAMNCS